MLFLAVLYRYYQNNNELGGDIRNSYKLYDRIYPILDYVNECFTETIELKELAKRTMMNKTYMCSYFKEVMNMTIFEYIMQVRINHGCLLLKTTNDTVTEIALKSGFNSAPYYNRVFKSIIGMSPNRYREKSKYSANTSEFAER
jgi:AraC-like DNA-binding protein